MKTFNSECMFMFKSHATNIQVSQLHLIPISASRSSGRRAPYSSEELKTRTYETFEGKQPDTPFWLVFFKNQTLTWLA